MPENESESSNGAYHEGGESYVNPMEQLLNDAQQEGVQPDPEFSGHSFRARLSDPEVEQSSFGGEVKFTQAYAIDEATGKPVEGVPVYFSGGYGNVKNAPSLVNIAEHGRNAFSLAFEGARDSDTTFEAISQTEAGKVGETHSMIAARKLPAAVDEGSVDAVVSRHQMNKAATLLAAMAERKIEQIDVIAQSEGALHTLVAAYSNPDKYRNIVLAYPAGLSGTDNPGKIMRNVGKDTIYKKLHRVNSENSFKNDLGGGFDTSSTAHKQGRAPGALVDGATVSFSEQSALLNGLRQNADAPGVALVAGLGDQIYPPEDYLRNLRSASDIDFMLVTDGPHGIAYRRDVMDQINDLLGALEVKQADRDAARQRGEDLPFVPLRDRLILPATISDERAEELRILADEVDAHDSTTTRPL